MWAMDKLEMSNAEREPRLAHWHFSSLPLSGLSDVGANFIPYLMGRWRASKKTISAAVSGEHPAALNPGVLYKPVMGLQDHAML